jgi:predicted NBD/HSP70 family sugar kinase
MKQKILGLCASCGNYSLADLSRELNSSIPTITKIVGELIDDGFLMDMGKIDTNGGRRPSIFGLNPSAGYLVGICERTEGIGIAVTDFKGEVITSHDSLGFTIEPTEASFRNLNEEVQKYLSENDIDHSKVIAYGINLSGRVNKDTGTCFNYNIGDDVPVMEMLEKSGFNAPVFLENDSRAMTYGEYIYSTETKGQDMIFLNVSWGLGMGMILNGKLHYGKSGFSGEIGHIPVLENNQICRCGKTGCLETGASGQALHRMVMEKLSSGRKSMLSAKFNRQEKIGIKDIMNAVMHEDVLAIETLEEIGIILGRSISGFINLFNPDQVVIGGGLAAAEEYLMLPVRTALQKYSLSSIKKDTVVRFSKLGMKAGPLGACVLSRSKLLGLL